MRVQLSIAVCLVWVVALAVAEEESTLEIQDADFDDIEDEKPVVALKKNGATGRTWDWAKKMAKWMGYDYDYEEDEYYDYYYPVQYVPADGQFAPATAAHGGSSYVSYQQHHPNHFGPARDDYVTDNDDWSITDMMFDMAVTILPIGLLLAALPSGLFTFAVRRRSFGSDNLLEDSFDSDEMPILRDLLENDWLAFTARECQERLFCEISKLGEREESSIIQKSFHYVSSLTPDFVARKFGMADVFRATRYRQCEIFTCGPSAPDAFAPVSNDLDLSTNNDTEADLTEPTKE